jgi:pimeloyl-ACP methyl ester carboxylesterase
MTDFVIFKKEGREIAVYTIGDGPMLLGLSGFGCSHYIYKDLLETLSKKFKVVLIDNRGAGKSGSTTTDYTIHDLATDAQFVMEKLNVESYGVMGISMGGFIAQSLAILDHEKVNALALMCTVSGGQNFMRPNPLTESGLRQFATLDPKISAEYSTAATTHPTLKLEHPEIFDHIVSERIKNRMPLEEQIRQNKAALLFLETSTDLKKIKCRTLAMAGSDDRFVNPKNCETFKYEIENCDVLYIDKCDHFFFMEKPIEVANALVNFFSKTI